ncbi:BQ2448_6458 [Microbotryum intermedium]|uniref:Vacuolar ATPase assembly protein VMA22 n=1 Tax=Microbotryum intermedium TaxID=269621 RepID=A0A238FSE0_9BASI|nr:BQ2448_6458 [Microbotryum intermedium]
MSIHAATDRTHDELLDELLIEYLIDLDRYQASQARLQAALKDAYFDLARSKLAVGAAKMSQDGYDLSQTCSNVAVSIKTENESNRANTTSRMESTPFYEHSLDRSSFSFALGPHPPPANPSPPSKSSEPTPSTSLRSRSHTSEPSRTNERASTPEETTRPPRSLQRSPLLQFSAFPPTALRSAEQSWQKVLQSTVEVTETKYKVEESEKRIRKCKAAKLDASSEPTNGLEKPQ